ncbi:MAG: serine/threonine protein kinase [Deltaproteobacteria bacterium]|nr:serine/threonine protein kinase [Deltaproteobacteria bacterium]
MPPISSEPKTPLPQLISDRYEPIGKLGEGGMAEVWLCEKHGMAGFRRRVVLKFLKPDDARDPEFIEMFVDEAQVGALLDHPNIPRVEELGEQAGIPFMVQEFVDGPSLHQILKASKDPLDQRFVAQVIADVARALHYAHEARGRDGRPLNLVHRDVSPTNILVAAKGQVKLIDFGVAKFEQRDTKTQAGQLKGKIRYMSPEFFRGNASHKSDLFALGVTFYALLVGQQAWAATATFAERQAYQRPSELRPDVAPGLQALVMQLLAENPDDRPRSGTDLAERLEHWLDTHGGKLSADDIAAVVRALFPRPNWRRFQATATSGSFLETFSGSTQLPQSTSAHLTSSQHTMTQVHLLPPSVVRLAVVSLVVIAMGMIALIALWVVGPERERTAPAEHTAQLDADASLAALLDKAEAALERGDHAETSSHLRASERLDATDADLMSRQESLRGRLKVSTQVAVIERLIETDASKALDRALALDAEYPG